MKRVLIIDDEYQIRSVLKEMFELEGFDVVEAGDGKEAIIAQKQNPADLVITDIFMPEKEGIETIMDLKKDYPDLKIIAMSGGSTCGAKNYLKIAENAGANYTFTKPVRFRDLMDAVRSLINDE